MNDLKLKEVKVWKTIQDYKHESNEPTLIAQKQTGSKISTDVVLKVEQAIDCLPNTQGKQLSGNTKKSFKLNRNSQRLITIWG